MKIIGQGFASTLNSLLYLYLCELLSHTIQRYHTRIFGLKMEGVSFGAPQEKHKPIA
jgi:hypothetical protein